MSLAQSSYDVSSNRITTSGFAYDAAGNQTRALIPGGTGSQRFQYDAANRLVKIKADDNTTVLATYTYGDSNERLVAEERSQRPYYVGEGGSTIAEYIESGSSTTPAWSKSYVYLGNRLLSTITPNGTGGEAVEFSHPDRLGTRIVTNPSTGTSYEQGTLPFGTPLNAESTGATNRRFTTYDRSATTGLDYALNRLSLRSVSHLAMPLLSAIQTASMEIKTRVPSLRNAYGGTSYFRHPDRNRFNLIVVS